jgi:hypothetical protein
VGVVTSDSLAAESLRTTGRFGHEGTQASQQPSRGTTTNNTDISGATTLNPAVDAEAREAQEGWNESAQLKAGAGLGKDAGIGPTYNLSATGGIPSTSGTQGSTGVPIAPTGSYAGSAIPGETQKPKGKNITEGGFDSSAPNASFNQEIGTKKDPGRVAEAAFEARNAQSGFEGARGPRQNGVTGESGFDALKADESA